MFIENANTMFNNRMFNIDTLGLSTGVYTVMHETYKRLIELSLKHKGFDTPTELSRYFNESNQTINNWRIRGISDGGLLNIQAKSGFNSTFIKHGVGSELIGGTDNNIEDGPDIKGECPLISFVQAGEWCQIIDNFQPGDAEDWFPCPVPHSPGTFVLRVKGESMLNPGGRPSFTPGDLIFCDPNIDAENGSLVIVRLENEKEATFKKLLIEGERRFIKALNPDWPDPIKEITEEATICGVVIFKGEVL